MTPGESQAQILAEVGDPHGTLRPAMAALWLAAAAHPLQYLYAKRSALDVRLAEEAPTIDIKLGNTVNRPESQVFTHLQTMRADVQAEIMRQEAILQGSRPGVAGLISTPASISPPRPDLPDPGSIYYTGGVYGRRRQTP